MARSPRSLATHSAACASGPPRPAKAKLRVQVVEGPRRQVQAEQLLLGVAGLDGRLDDAEDFRRRLALPVQVAQKHRAAFLVHRLAAVSA
jgi:hypothetical protein